VSTLSKSSIDSPAQITTFSQIMPTGTLVLDKACITGLLREAVEVACRNPIDTLEPRKW
jgi:hypothetical protein